ncbi:MAG: M13 family metallopeptidase [Deltaproteobacteria bacterium]|nr:M13 family metallopeptidase [Deltaproteobacteria bacterium]
MTQRTDSNMLWNRSRAALGVAALSGCFFLGCGTPPAPVVDDEASQEPAGLSQAEIAESVASSLDLSADPCEDMYRYACGGWMDQAEIPGDQSRWVRSLSVMREENRQALREILEEPVGEGASETEALVGAYYGSCMNEEAIAAAGLAPLAPYQQAFSEVDSLESFMSQVGRLHGDGILAFFDPVTLLDFKNPDLYIAYYNQGGIGLPERDFYFRDDEKSREVLRAYESHIARMLVLAGRSEGEAAEAAEGILAFETKLAGLSRRPAEMRDFESLYNRVDLEGLEALVPNLDWKAYQAGTGRPGVIPISLTVPEFFEGLNELMPSADMNMLRAYLEFHLLNSIYDLLPDAFLAEHFDFFGRRLEGQQEMEVRWKRCASLTDQALGEAVGRLYVERHFPGDSKEKALGMIAEVEKALERSLPDLAWMDETTRQRAVEKMAAITNKIGYPDTWRDYSALELGPDTFFANGIAGLRFEAMRTLNQVGTQVDRGEWGMTPPTVNAYYNPTRNEIVFPAGILQPPIFHRDFPSAMNLGAMGAVVGHEVTHGFDDAGRKFNSVGELKEWWEPEVAERFEERAQCVEKLYNTYEVQPGLNVNGKLTLGENIADLGGVKSSFGALQHTLGAASKEPSIVEGLNQEQLFFVSYAQVWCGLATPEADRLQVRSNTHSPMKFRVNGPLSNLPAFAEAFSCQEGSAMRRDPVCEVW